MDSGRAGLEQRCDRTTDRQTDGVLELGLGRGPGLGASSGDDSGSLGLLPYVPHVWNQLTNNEMYKTEIKLIFL